MRPARHPRRCRRGPEQGQVGGLEAVAFGVLVFVLGTLLVANAWGVVDAKLAATAAAREAVRSYVEADADLSARAAASDAARRALEGHGRTWDRARIEVGGAPFGRCAQVTAVVRYQVPLVVVPGLGAHGRGLTVTGDHSEVVDPYRSGLDGEIRCAR